MFCLEHESKRDSCAYRHDRIALELSLVIRQVTLPIFMVSAVDEISGNRELQAESLAQDEVVSSSYACAEEVTFPMLSIKSANMHLVNVESTISDVGAEERSRKSTMEPMAVFRLEREVFPFRPSIFQWIV